MVFHNSSLRNFFLLSIIFHLGLFSFIQFKRQSAQGLSSGLALSLGKTQEYSLPEMIAKTRSKRTTPSASLPELPEVPSPASETVSSTSTQSISNTEEDSIQARYNGLIAKMINDQKHYPRMARALQHEGRVLVKMTLDKDGNILGLDILQKPAYESLVRAALETIKKVKQFPPIPKELEKDVISFNIPIDYRLTL